MESILKHCEEYERGKLAKKLIPFGGSYSEFEVQAELLFGLRDKGYLVKGEVFSIDQKCRFDLVIFDEDKFPIEIIEVKKLKREKTYKRRQENKKQLDKYKRYFHKVTLIAGMKAAKKYLENKQDYLKKG